MRSSKAAFSLLLTLLGFSKQILGDEGHSLCAHHLVSIESSFDSDSDDYSKPEVGIYVEFLKSVLNEIKVTSSNFASLQIQFLESLRASENPIDPTEPLMATLSSQFPDRDGFPFFASHFLILIQSKRPLASLVARMSPRSWVYILNWISQQIDDLRIRSRLTLDSKASTTNDFLDLPDSFGEIRLHALFRMHKWQEALLLLQEWRTTTKYVNTRNHLGKTPLDIFNQYKTQMIGPNSTQFVVEILKNLHWRKAKTKKEMIRVDEDLLRSVVTDDIEMTRDLLDLGADPDFLSTMSTRPISELQSKGDRPLHVAALKGQVPMISLLVASGADVNGQIGQHKKRTPLHLAAQQGHTSAIQKLIELGASPNATDVDKHTPAHLAVGSGNAEALNALIDLGADLELYNNLEQRPLDILFVNLNNSWDGYKLEWAFKEFKKVKWNLNSIGHLGYTSVTQSFLRNTPAFKFLAEADADMEAPDGHGKTVYDYLNESRVAFLKPDFVGEHLLILANYLLEKGIPPESRGLIKNLETGMYEFDNAKRVAEKK